MMSLMSMIFLVLFSTLAIGFYASTTTQMEVSVNDQRVLIAQTSAESGMDFLRYHLSQVCIPPNTASNQVLNVLYTNLQNQLNGTSNFGSNTISVNNNVIYIPSANSIPLSTDGTQAFTATITTWGSGIVVKSTGTYASAAGTTVTRAISMDFLLQPIPTSVFNYAVASAGQVVVSKNTLTGIVGVPASVASILSNATTAGAVTVSGGNVGGSLFIQTGATAVYTGGSVAGSNSNAVIQANDVHTVPPQDFPVVDTSVFQQYAVNNWVSGHVTQQNIYIPPGSNPKFNGGDTVQGIMYIASPNQVTFNGNFNLDGFIVFENNASTTTDSISFSGNVTTAALPSGSQFDAMRSISGIGIMAPTASMSMSGSASSYVKGNVIAKSFTVSGAGTLEIDGGTLMTLSTGAKSTWFNGSKNIMFSATGQNNQPSAGVSYNQYFAPIQTTYQEIMP